MEIFFDGEKYGIVSEEQLRGYNDIYELKQQLQLICEGNNRVICQIKLDGDELSILSKDDFRLNNLDLIERLDVKTAVPKELALESINSMPEVISQHRDFFLRAIEYYESSKQNEFIEEFMKGLGGLVWLNVVVRSIQEVLNIPLNSIVFRGEDMMNKFRQFQITLESIENYTENGEWETLTVLLREKLIPQLKYWEGVSTIVLKKSKGDS